MSETGWRGSAELWLDAAFQALIEGGVDAVRILPLAKKLSLSRTSFYWFFKDREELLGALVERWRAKNTGAIVKQSEAYAESLAEALLNVFDCWLDVDLFDSQFEHAIRSWALQSEDVSKAVEAADAARIGALAALFRRFQTEPGMADVRARTVYLVQIGYISMNTREELEVRMRRIPDYIEIFAGRRPEPREMARFHARHGFVPPTPG